MEDQLTLPEKVEEGWISGPVGSLRLAEIHPKAPVQVVFIHGLGGNLEQWAGQLRLVGEGLHAVAFDLPGHGGSDPVAGASLAMHAASIGAVLNGLKLRRPVLVAHSLGALAALRYAATHHQRVAGLFLIDPTGDQTMISMTEHDEFLRALHKDPGGEMAWNYRQMLSESRPQVAKKVLETLATVSDEALVTTLKSSHEISPSADLKQYKGAVHLVLSDLNDLPSALHHLHPEIPTTRMPGTSHWLMMDRPVEVWDLLLNFLGELKEVDQ
jgi:pimeloyl-ACP methyl ester carboxylesterase